MLRRIVNILSSLKLPRPTSTFKIVHIEGTPQNKDIMVTYQVCGKSTISRGKPETLVSELMHIDGFSKDDSNLINNLAITEKLYPAFRIASISFVGEIIRFEIEDTSSKYSFFLTAEEIVASNNILNNFSHNDIAIIYYQLTNEDIIRRVALKAQRFRESNNPSKSEIYLLNNKGI